MAVGVACPLPIDKLNFWLTSCYMFECWDWMSLFLWVLDDYLCVG